MDLETVGKPNVMVSFSGCDDDSYITNQLSNLSPDEFIKTAEKLDNIKDSAFMQKFEQILNENQENEYNRTQVEDRSLTSQEIRSQEKNRDKFQLNKKGSPRLLETYDCRSNSNKGSYLNLQLRQN